MTPDPTKLLELRTKNAMNQEALAGAAKVSVRTVQRAEAGDPIDLQTAQQIAVALGVSPTQLLADEALRTEPEESGFQRVALLPTLTARALLDAIADCDECRLDHAVDINSDALTAAIEFCEALGPSLPVLCPEVTNFNGNSADPSRKMIDRLKLESRLNASLADLRKASVAAYAGTYYDFIQRPRYSIDDDMWLTSRNQKIEGVKFGLVRLGPADRSQLVERVSVTECPF